jgi:hypothetical protein
MELPDGRGTAHRLGQRAVDYFRMPRRLLVVEKVIRRVSGQLVLGPCVHASEAEAGTIPVEVRRVDGTSFPAKAVVALSSVRPGQAGVKAVKAYLRLLGVREHVAAGTEIWTVGKNGRGQVAAWEREHGALTAEELRRADDVLDRVVTVRPRRRRAKGGTRNV